MGYRPSSRPPKGEWGIALDQRRRDDDLSLSAAFELWHEGLGLSPRSRAAYDALEHGKTPKPAQERYLRQVLKIEPAKAVVEAQLEPTLASALTALANELHDARTWREEADARFRALESELKSLRARRGAGASSRQPAPLG